MIRPLMFPLTLVLLLVACGGGGGGTSDQTSTLPVPGEHPTPSTSPAEAAFLLANLERQAAGLPLLEWHPGAAEVAYNHSVDMAVRSFFSHVNPDGMDPGDRLVAGGVTMSGWAENIAKGYPTAEAVTTGWMNSPGHRANILLPWVTHMGVGVASGPGGPYWTQVFIALP